jgi:hypothetical protein
MRSVFQHCPTLSRILHIAFPAQHGKLAEFFGNWSWISVSHVCGKSSGL